jgi:hypothetical protein
MIAIIAVQLRSLVCLWLALLSMILMTSACLASIGTSGCTVAYGRQAHMSTGYDGHSLLAFDYDSSGRTRERRKWVDEGV